MTKSDRRNPMFNREVNEFSATAKSVHLYHLVLVEFDSARADIGRVHARSALRYSTNAHPAHLAEARHHIRHLVAV
jgi:hypothetical protein